VLRYAAGELGRLPRQRFSAIYVCDLRMFSRHNIVRSGHSRRFADARVRSACPPRAAAKRTWQDFAYLFGHTLQRDHQYEFRPIDIPAMADGSIQLF
jgi:hypothetical protein